MEKVVLPFVADRMRHFHPVAARCILRILPFCFPRISTLYLRLTRVTANCLFLVIYTRAHILTKTLIDD